MSIRVIKPEPPDTREPERLLRLLAERCLEKFGDADDASLAERMLAFLSGSEYSFSPAECLRAASDARADVRAKDSRRRNERAVNFSLCFILLLLIGLVLWAIFSR